MEYARRVSKTYLARNTRRVINEVQRGYTAVIENHGEPEVAMIDIIDFYILRAAMRFHSVDLDVNAASGLKDAAVASLADVQARYDLVLGYYLAEAISLGRAAELLGLPWLDLRTRLLRLDVPLRTAPATLDEARAEVEAALAWTASA